VKCLINKAERKCSECLGERSERLPGGGRICIERLDGRKVVEEVWGWDEG
jgi:hypothetical protein